MNTTAATLGRITAIASGKGGVGKTWLSITLSHALARQGRRVLLFDGDLGLANIDIQLGLMPTHDLGAVLDGMALAEAVTRCEPGGFDVLAGRSGSGALAQLDSAALDRVLQVVRNAAGLYDEVIFDLAAGLDRGVRRMAARSDELLVVATDEPTSLTDAYAVLKLHAGDGGTGRSRILVNQARSAGDGQRTYSALARACQTFLHRTPGLGGIVRRDDKVRDAIRRQVPLLTRHPACEAAQDVEAVARRLLAG
jgi:flagellar biosynthesis protein FlhG